MYPQVISHSAGAEVLDYDPPAGVRHTALRRYGMDADRFGQDAPEAAYRAHGRAVNTARQEVGARQRRALREELARIAAVQRA